MIKGMLTTIIEAPDHLQGINPPSDEVKLCASYPYPSEPYGEQNSSARESLIGSRRRMNGYHE